jgi:glycosyltransferase involved in cell wall biosynthesis
MMKTKISIIIPFYNEQENVPDLVSKLNDFCESNQHLTFEIIFVNDGSTDSSCDLIKGFKNLRFSGRLINLARNFGSHAALRAGISEATGELITFLYADLQDPPEIIKELLLKIGDGNEIVWAHRKSTDIKRMEKLFSALYSRMMRKFALSNYPEKGFDIVMFTRKVKDQLDLNVESNSSVFLQILNFGFKQSFIEYHRHERRKGKSKWTLAKKIKLIIDSFVSFSYFPIRMVSVIGILMFLIGLGWSVYIVLRTLLYHDLSPGWPTLISIIMLGFGITNIALGIIAEYLWRTLDSARKRPAFIIDKIIDLN